MVKYAVAYRELVDMLIVMKYDFELIWNSVMYLVHSSFNNNDNLTSNKRREGNPVSVGLSRSDTASHQVNTFNTFHLNSLIMNQDAPLWCGMWLYNGRLWKTERRMGQMSQGSLQTTPWATNLQGGKNKHKRWKTKMRERRDIQIKNRASRWRRQKGKQRSFFFLNRAVWMLWVFPSDRLLIDDMVIAVYYIRKSL